MVLNQSAEKADKIQTPQRTQQTQHNVSLIDHFEEG